MTFTINGVPLENPTYGWRLGASTMPYATVQNTFAGVSRTGRDGLTLFPSTRGTILPAFEVIAKTEHWETLMALFSSPGDLVIRQVGVPGISARGKFKSSSEPVHTERGRITYTTFFVEIGDGCWRGDEITSAIAMAAPAGVTLPVFPGMSAPVQDAVVRFKGPLGKPQLTDPSGAFVVLDGTVAAGQYVRFDLRTGRAWLTTTDTWQGGSEISGLVDFGGPRGVFEITPQFPTPADPASREGRLTLTQQSYNTGAGFQVRGAAAHLI